MSTSTQRMTAEELLRMPDDGFRYELVRGELRSMTPPGNEHGYIAGIVFGELYQYLKKNKLGRIYIAETGFKISSNPDTVRAPDVAFVAQERVEQFGDMKGYLPCAPDLVVEVISPGDPYIEVNEKVLEWLDAGTRMVIVVDPPGRTVTVYRSETDIAILRENDILEGGDVVPGWELPVREIFE
ncbi:MAG: Uma2 family endonuclease [bacterium]